MKLTIDRNDLAGTLGRVVPFAAPEGKTAEPVLTSLSLSLSNAVLTARCVNTLGQAEAGVAVEDPGQKDGALLLSAKLLLQTVRNMPEGDLVLEQKEEGLSIQGYGPTIVLRGRMGEDFPPSVFDRVEGTLLLETKLPADQFLAAVQGTSPAAGAQGARPILMGVFFDNHDGALRMVATDSYRLNYYDVDAPWDLETLGCPILAARSLVKVAGAVSDGLEALKGDEELVVEVVVSQDAVVFRVEGVARYSLRRTDGTYPNYRRAVRLVTKAKTAEVTTDRKALMAAVRRAITVAGDAVPLRLEINEGAIEVVTQAKNRGNSHEALGGLFEIAAPIRTSLNCKYFGEALRLVKTDRVVMDVPKPPNPILIRAEEEDAPLMQMVMPVRV